LRVPAEAAIEVQEIDAFGQRPAAFALQIPADIVLDRVEHAVRMSAFDGQWIGFLHG
jgi:hypothetical protein